MKSVIVNKLNREHNETLVQCSVKSLISLIQKFSKLSGITLGRSKLELIALIINYSRFGSIRYYETKRIKLGILGIFLIFSVCVNRIGHTGDNTVYLLWFSVHASS